MFDSLLKRSSISTIMNKSLPSAFNTLCLIGAAYDVRFPFTEINFTKASAEDRQKFEGVTCVRCSVVLFPSSFLGVCAPAIISERRSAVEEWVEIPLQLILLPSARHAFVQAQKRRKSFGPSLIPDACSNILLECSICSGVGSGDPSANSPPLMEKVSSSLSSSS